MIGIPMEELEDKLEIEEEAKALPKAPEEPNNKLKAGEEPIQCD